MASGWALVGAGTSGRLAGVDDPNAKPLLPSGTEDVCKFIHDQWKLTVRHSDPRDASELALPKPFTVPTAGQTFHSFFYWDTYFTSLGLLLDGQENQARDNADDMMFLVERLGFIPNSNAIWGHNRTQLPVSSALYADVFRWSRDQPWLAQALIALEREHAFFQGMRGTACGLNRAYHHANPQYLWQFAEDIRSRLPSLPVESEARFQAAGHALSECEVWDFTPRFDGRCGDFCPVDTNALLFLMEQNGAAFCEQLGNGKAGVWRERAERRRALLTRLCWNEARGMFFDYDWANQRQSRVVSAANFFVLWSGAATPEQAGLVVKNLKQLEFAHGITTCAPGDRKQVYQWDHPNGWPPLQFGAIEGLRRYGFEEAARRIAAKYAATVTRNFKATGNLWEKYNAVTGGIDVRDEYAMPPMLGWTAGVFFHACKLLKSAGDALPIRGELKPL